MISICIVNYNTRDLTLKALQSIYEHCKRDDFEIILLDNTPKKNIEEADIAAFPHVKLYKSISNSFFSGGFNKAVELSQGEYCVIMSSDIFLRDDAITTLYDFIRHRPDVGAVEGTLILPRNNEIVRTSSKELTPFRDFVRSRNITKKIFSKVYQDYSYADWDRRSNREVEVITNAFMMIRRDTFLEIGGFEEAMKLYFTEERMSDLLRQKGLKLWHLADAMVEHVECASTDTCPSPWIKSLYQSDKKLYFLLKSFRS